jgi:phosphoenolpyruvate carboxylase
VAQELPLLASMEPSFLPHYTRIAARKLLFFHGRRGARGAETRVRRGGGPRQAAVLAGKLSSVEWRSLVKAPLMHW